MEPKRALALVMLLAVALLIPLAAVGITAFASSDEWGIDFEWVDDRDQNHWEWEYDGWVERGNVDYSGPLDD